MIDSSNTFAILHPNMHEVDDRYTVAVQEYVEIIRDLTSDHRVARVKDIAEARGVTRSSVSTALGTLIDLGLVHHEHYGYVTLTDEGRRLGDILTQRHSIIQRFLCEFVGLPNESADQEACTLEHAMSPEALMGLVRFIQVVEKCPDCSSAYGSESISNE